MSEKTLILLAILAAFRPSNAAEVRWHMATPVTNQVVGVKQIDGLFYTKWVVETNDSPRRVMDGFNDPSRFTYFLTNYSGNIWVTNYLYTPYICNKEHLDKSQHTETRYVERVLYYFLVWRGRTNVNCLEAIPITNIVHHWHYDKAVINED